MAPAVRIRWFFIGDDAKPLGTYTRFASGNWANEKAAEQFWTGTGEISPDPQKRRWYNGARIVPSRCSGNPIGSADQFAGNIPWPWVPLPVNACCLARAPVPFRFAFHADVPDPCFLCTDWPTVLTATFGGDGGDAPPTTCANCAALNGQQLLCWPLTSCNWKSQAFTYCGVDYYLQITLASGSPWAFTDVAMNQVSDDTTVSLWSGNFGSTPCQLPQTVTGGGSVPGGCNLPTSVTVNGSLRPMIVSGSMRYAFRWKADRHNVVTSKFNAKYLISADSVTPDPGDPCPNILYAPANVILRVPNWSNSGCSDCANVANDYLLPQTGACSWSANFPVVLCGSTRTLQINVTASGGPPFQVDCTLFTGGASPLILATFSSSFSSPPSLPLTLPETIGGSSGCVEPTNVQVLIGP